MSDDRINRYTGAYFDANTLNNLTEALAEARKFFKTEATPASEQAVMRIEDALRTLNMPRIDKVQLGPTDDIRSDNVRKLLENIVRLFSDLGVDVLSLSKIKKSLDYTGVSIGYNLNLLDSKGYITRENIGSSHDQRFIRLTEKTKSLA